MGYKGILRYIFLFIEKLNSYTSDVSVTVSFSMKKYLDTIKPNTYVIHNGSACGFDLTKKNIKEKNVIKNIITYVGRLKKERFIYTLDIIKYFEKRGRGI